MAAAKPPDPDLIRYLIERHPDSVALWQQKRFTPNRTFDSVSPAPPDPSPQFTPNCEIIALRDRSPLREPLSDRESFPLEGMDVVDPATSSQSDDSDAFTVVESKKRKRKNKKPAASDTEPPSKNAAKARNSPPAATATANSQNYSADRLQNSPVDPITVAHAGSASAVPRVVRPPPLFIQDKEKWNRVSALMRDKSINFTNARSTQQGIKVSLPTPTDHRRLTSLLKTESIGFHTYALEDERVFRAVLRGVPKEVDTDLVLEDLLRQGFPVHAVHRMYNGRTKEPYNLLLVISDLSKEGKSICNRLSTVCDLSGISVERPARNGHVGQCHRCQLYGHASRNCFAKPRCVKCLGDHGTPDCPRPKDRSLCTEPPSCVLCRASGHTANYRGCPKAPRKNPGVVKRPSAAQLPRAQPPVMTSQDFPSLRSRPALSGFSIIAGPPELRPAWAKPAAPIAKTTPQVNLAPQANHAPQAKSAPQAITNESRSTSGPSVPEDDDFALVCRFASTINFDQIRVLANEIRATDNKPEQRLAVALKHSRLISAIQNFKSYSP